MLPMWKDVDFHDGREKARPQRSWESVSKVLPSHGESAEVKEEKHKMFGGSEILQTKWSQKRHGGGPD